MKIPSNIIRELLDLNISTSELKEMSRLNINSISNSTHTRLNKTLSTTNNKIKSDRIGELLNRVYPIIGDVNNEAVPTRRSTEQAATPASPLSHHRSTEYIYIDPQDVFQQIVKNIWGYEVLALNSRHEASDIQAGIWRSKHQPGKYGINIPEKKQFSLANDLDSAIKFLKYHGIEPRTSNGENIIVRGTNLIFTRRYDLEYKYNIRIKPIVIASKEIGCLFSTINPQQQYNDRILLSAYGGRRDENKTFIMPPDISLKIAGKTNITLISKPLMYAEAFKNCIARNGNVAQLYDFFDKKTTTVPDYKLNTETGTTPEDAASFVSKMKGNNGTSSFDYLLLNNKVKELYLSDVLQAIKDTQRHQSPKDIICHFCLSENAKAEKFNYLDYSINGISPG